jgi:hypothetical protein
MESQDMPLPKMFKVWNINFIDNMQETNSTRSLEHLIIRIAT